MWEYKDLSLQVSVFGEPPFENYAEKQEGKFNKMIRELGADGWELVTVIERKYEHTSNTKSGEIARLWYAWLKRWVAD